MDGDCLIQAERKLSSETIGRKVSSDKHNRSSGVEMVFIDYLRASSRFLLLTRIYFSQDISRCLESVASSPRINIIHVEHSYLVLVLNQ